MPGGTYWDRWLSTPFGFTSWTHRALGVQVLNLAYRSGVAWNETSYSNPEFDRLLDKAGGLADVNGAPQGHGRNPGRLARRRGDRPDVLAVGVCVSLHAGQEHLRPGRVRASLQQGVARLGDARAASIGPASAHVRSRPIFFIQ